MKKYILILTTVINENAFKDYISNKTVNGFEVHLEIVISPNADYIQSIIDETYSRLNEPFFVILGGSCDTIPPRRIGVYPDPEYISDSRYAFKKDGNVKCYIGRFPTDDYSILHNLCLFYLAHQSSPFPGSIFLISAAKSHESNADVIKDSILKNINTVQHFKLEQNNEAQLCKDLEEAKPDFICYMGHGNRYGWRFALKDIDITGESSTLIDILQTPHIMSLACSTGKMNTDLSSLSLKTILEEKALTFWGATTTTYGAPNELISNNFWLCYANNDKIKYIGEMYFQVLRFVNDNPRMDDFHYTYNLWGDPTICIK